MNRISVTNRVAFGFTLLTLLALIGGGLAYVVVSTLGTTFNDYMTTSRQYVVVADFVEDLFEARVAALSYRGGGDPAQAENVFQNIAEIKRDSSDLALFADAPDVAAIIQDVATGADNYAATFTSLRTIRAEMNTQIVALRTEVDAASTTLAGLKTDALRSGDTALVTNIADASMQLQAVDAALPSIFVYDGAVTGITANLSDVRAALQAAIGSGTGSVDALSDILAQTDSFESDFQGLTESLSKYEALGTGGLDQIGPQMQASLEAASDLIVANHESLGTNGEERVDTALTLTPLYIAVTLITSLVLSLVVARWIAVPLRRLVAQTEALSQGDTDITIVGSEHDHELGRMAKALKMFQTALIEREQAGKAAEVARIMQDSVVETLSDAMQDMADGALDRRIHDEWDPVYLPLRDNYNAAMSKLEMVIRDIATVSAVLKDNANQMEQSSNNLSQRTENQAATLEQAAAALKELTDAVRSSADRGQDVEGAVIKARNNAKESEGVVKEAVAAMDEMEESSRQIAQITDVISDISFQTNLLALNAGVEAARAGDAGKGFAVVASEVRALAQRSSEAAQEVSQLIETSSLQVSKGTRLVGEAGNALKDIIAQVDQVSNLIVEITQSASDQSLAITEISVGVNQLDQVTQENAGLVHNSQALGETLVVQARRLEGMLNEFRNSHENDVHQTSAAA